MKVLVTGCLGFVGTNLSVHYGGKRDCHVVGIDNKFKSYGLTENYSLLQQAGVEYSYCDIRNFHDVENVYEQHGPFDVIFHMAAQVAFKCSVENPRLDFEINVSIFEPSIILNHF